MEMKLTPIPEPKCNHDYGIYTTIEVHCLTSIPPKYYGRCRVCGARTENCFSSQEAILCAAYEKFKD